MTIDLYSAFVEDLEATFCFFDLQETKEFPRNTQYPVRDFLVLGQPTQSASQKPFSCKSDFKGKNTLCPGVPLMYCKILVAAFMCGTLGCDKNWLSLCTA